MVKLERKDIEAALLLCWLKYIAVSEEDVKSMKDVPVLVKEEPETVEKSKRKLLRIKKNENLETPDFQLSKRVKNSSSGLLNLTKNPETDEAASSSRNSNPNPKRGRVLPSTLMNSPPKFPPILNLRTLIGQCSNPFMKQLTNSDVDEHQGRLLLNNEYVRKQLLPFLNEETEDVANGINVKTFDPMGKFYHMTFKTWGNHKSYLLLGSWKQFVQEHGLKESDRVTGWMFRHNQTGELCFALTW